MTELNETPLHRDLPPFEQPLQLRVYVLVMRKGVRQVGCVGTVDIPLQTMKRSEQIEAWFPIVAPYVAEDAFAGELLLSIRLSEIPVLVPSEYQPLSDVSYLRLTLCRLH